MTVARLAGSTESSKATSSARRRPTWLSSDGSCGWKPKRLRPNTCTSLPVSSRVTASPFIRFQICDSTGSAASSRSRYGPPTTSADSAAARSRSAAELFQQGAAGQYVARQPQVEGSRQRLPQPRFVRQVQVEQMDGRGINDL